MWSSRASGRVSHTRYGCRAIPENLAATHSPENLLSSDSISGGPRISSSDRPLAVVSRKVASDLSRYFGRADSGRVIYGGLDLSRSIPRRASLRPDARANLGLAENDFALLLIGMAGRTKSSQLLESAGMLRDSRLTSWVAAGTILLRTRAAIERHHLNGRAHFCRRALMSNSFMPQPMPTSVLHWRTLSRSLPRRHASGLPVITSRRRGCRNYFSGSGWPHSRRP